MIAASGRIPPLALLLLLVSCRSEPKYYHADYLYYGDNPQAILEEYKDAENDTGPDALIGKMKMLSAALLLEDWNVAEALSLDVSTAVNIHLAGQEGERDALSSFGSERDKPFKGEPHEQAMADFYLGVLRYRRGDYEGALSCFRSALAKDRGSFLLPVEKDDAQRGEDNAARYIYDSDYSTFELFAAKCWSELGEPEQAAEAIERAKSIRPDLADLFDQAMDPENNVLVLIEAGGAPMKLGSGPRNAVLAYRPSAGFSLDSVHLNGEEIPFGLTDDLYEQATTIGGRQVDELNLAKAGRQETLKAIGLGTTIAGSVITAASRDRRTRNAGLIVLAAGILTMIFAETAFEAEADTRAWTLLPGTLLVAVGRFPAGAEHRLEVSGGGHTRSWENITLGEENNLLMVRLLPRYSGTHDISNRYRGRHPRGRPD